MKKNCQITKCNAFHLNCDKFLMGENSLYRNQLWFDKAKPHSTTIISQTEFFIPHSISFSIILCIWIPSNTTSVIYSLPLLWASRRKILVLDKKVHIAIFLAFPNQKVQNQLKFFAHNFLFLPVFSSTIPTYLPS